MPELPEVHTTVEGLKKEIVGKTIKDVWSDFHIKTAHGERQTLKNKKYFEKFKKIVKGAKIKSIERRGKNILIHLNPSTSSGQVKYTIIIHMKMTGHLMVKNYEKEKKFVHLVFSLSGGKHLVLSDMRKFASVTLAKTEELHLHDAVGALGPDPLDPKFNAKQLYEIISKRGGIPIKSALMDQTAIAGIGNIYSDEILCGSSVHPLSSSSAIPEKKYNEIYKVMRKILLFSIKKGGDSKSDYRNIFGEKGGFQDFHQVYGKRQKPCPKKGCSGIIERIVVRGRSAHFCPVHQKLFPQIQK